MATTRRISQRSRLEVHLAAPELAPDMQVGWLYPADRRIHLPPSFEYAEAWLDRQQPFWLDPRLALYPGEQHSPQERGFGIFLDSAPDRWGRVLMERREASQAIREGRSVRRLTELDFLLGVHDFTRTGALRLRRSPTVPDVDSPFLDNHPLPAPPMTDLRELADVAQRIEAPGSEALPEYERWLAMLIAPGTSLGGARPKANFTYPDGSLWLAKFPAHDDRHDWGGWEYLTHQLARDSGIQVPDSELLALGQRYRTFCVRRFDRGLLGQSQARRMYASAMTLLERQDGQGGSYLDLVEFLEHNGAPGLSQDLQQLFRRAVFNLLVGNRDDHLRNHGFLRAPEGWRLSPAFDLNPNRDKRDHALTWDGHLAEPHLPALLETAPFYRLKPAAARQVVAEVTGVVAGWRQRALALALPGPEIQLMETVFAV